MINHIHECCQNKNKPVKFNELKEKYVYFKISQKS